MSYKLCNKVAALELLRYTNFTYHICYLQADNQRLGRMAEWSKAVDSSYFEYLQRRSLVIPTYPGFESQFYQIFLYLKYRNLRSFFLLNQIPREKPLCTWLWYLYQVAVTRSALLHLSVGTMAEAERHIVIVGGGIIGISIAYYTSLRSDCPKVTVLESSKDLAPGASGKAGGFLALDWHGTSTASLASLSYELHHELAKKENGAELWGYREVETHQLSLDTSRKARSRPKIDWLNQQVFISSSPIGGGGSTAQVTPGELTQFLANKAKEAGVEIRLQTKAIGLDLNESSRVKGVKIQVNGEEQVLPATDVVVAAGPWTGKLLQTWFTPSTMPAYLRSASMIEGSRAHSIKIQAAKGHQLSPDCFFSEMRYGNSAGAPEFYIRPKGVAYVSGGSDDVPIPELADDVTFDPKRTAELQIQAGVLSPEYLDVKNDAELLAEQACYLPISPRTAAPILGGSAENGIYVAAGHAVWGISNSLGTGKVMSELLLDGKSISADIHHLQP